jgi:hypothetical protein
MSQPADQVPEVVCFMFIPIYPWLYDVCVHYVVMYICTVSVIGPVAVDSAHK